MALPDKVEAVKKVSETLSKGSEELERVAPNKEHFQSLIENQPLKPGSIEKIDVKPFASEEIQSVESKPVFAEENVSAQKSGSSTDQERKHKRQSGTEEIEGISAAGSKKSGKSASLMDEVGKIHGNVSKISNLSPETIKTQAKDLIAQIDQVKTQLAQSQTEIKPSYQTLLRNRLTHVDDNLKIALSKAGVEYTPPSAVTNAGKANPAGKVNPVERFITLLTNSQHQLENIQLSVEQVNIGGKELSPGNMLAIQLKMNYAQQQIELFTSLLNKALESTKTIMNVQV